MSSFYQGFSEQEVRDSRLKYGSNTLTPPKSRSWCKMLFSKFNDPIIKVLLGVTVLSILIALVPMYTEGIGFSECEFEESLGIIFAVLLATGIGFWFELDANRRFETLNQNKSDRKVKVFRNGQMIEVEESEIVVGDTIWVEAGDEIPADGVLLESLALSVNESRLTGEASCLKSSRPEDKDSEATYDTGSVYKGSTVIEGSAVVQINQVGDQTEYGRIAKQATELVEESTPLNRQLEVLAKKIGRYGYLVAALIFIILIAKDIFSGSISSIGDTHSIHQILQRFMIAVTIIVVSVPEGLPMSVTLSLALSVRRMLIDNNLVRRMHACETMGAATVICTDKTGTLTQNRMHVEAFWPETSRMDWTSIAEAIANNSTAHVSQDQGQYNGVGNPTEIALLQWLMDHELYYASLRDQCEISDRLAFSTENKFMMSCGRIANSSRLWIKGAPEKVIERCTHLQTDQGIEDIDQYRDSLNQQLSSWQNQAMRTLAIGVKMDHADQVDSQAHGFLLLGVVAIMDPIRGDVAQAVQSCLSAGIQVKIVTGDTIGTAREIARRIGIWTDQDHDAHWITGPDFEKLTDDQALSRIKALKIMCRARPSDKQRLVRLLQSSGEIVAVTGDGTNDAPALNRADVGLSMGTGTSVAKEASDITLLDDSFHSIASAVKWGRSLYQNIQRFVVFQLTINILALLIVFFGALFGHEIPLTVTQMLWVNLIMDSFASAALASLPPNDAVMNHKPRNNNDFIVTRTMKRFIITCSLLFFVALLSLFIFWLDENGTMTPYRLSLFFTIFVFIQFWNLFNAKAFFTQQSAFFQIRKSTGFLVIALTILIGQFLIVTYGGKMFRTCPLSWCDWTLALLGTSVVLWIGEAIRWFNRTKHSQS